MLLFRFKKQNSKNILDMTFQMISYKDILTIFFFILRNMSLYSFSICFIVSTLTFLFFNNYYSFNYLCKRISFRHVCFIVLFKDFQYYSNHSVINPLHYAVGLFLYPLKIYENIRKTPVFIFYLWFTLETFCMQIKARN